MEDSKNFSLKWFKSVKREQLADLVIEEQKLKNQLLKKELGQVDSKPTQLKFYSKLMLVNDVLTIVLNDGSLITRTGADQDLFIRVREAKSENDILRVLNSNKNTPKGDNRDNKDEIYESVDISFFEGLEDFVIEDGSLYFVGIPRSLPALMITNLTTIIRRYMKGEIIDPSYARDDEYLSIKRFFMWSCLNPRAEVAESLYDFLMRNSFRITKRGFFVALRNVVSLENENGDNSLVQFVSNAYNKIKAIWKKNPANFEVIVQNGQYRFEKTKETSDAYAGRWVGNLLDLYMDLPNMRENRFTDDHTRTFDIRIGKIVNMPPEKCSWSTRDCAEAGLHFTADQINYVGCGDTSVLVLINPMKVVGIGSVKGRCYEYLPIMTVPREEATEILHDLDFDTLELDEAFTAHEFEDLENIVKEGFAKETTKHEFNIPPLSTEVLEDIIKNLEEMRKVTSKRVVKVK